MMRDQPAESDWKMFKAMVPEWRERYLRERNIELISILQDEASTPTERFWSASERMEKIGGVLRACLDDHKRSNMMSALRLMYHHQLISDEDLKGFSGEVRERFAGGSNKGRVF
jgi:hypothetical protein